MESSVYEEVEKVVREMKRVEGKICVALFGGYSGGDDDEGSVIDLLVVSKDRKELDGCLNYIYMVTAQSDFFLRAIGLTLKESRGPPLYESVFRGGRIYAGDDVKKLLTPRHRPCPGNLWHGKT